MTLALGGISLTAFTKIGTIKVVYLPKNNIAMTGAWSPKLAPIITGVKNA